MMKWLVTKSSLVLSVSIKERWLAWLNKYLFLSIVSCCSVNSRLMLWVCRNLGCRCLLCLARPSYDVTQFWCLVSVISNILRQCCSGSKMRFPWLSNEKVLLGNDKPILICGNAVICSCCLDTSDVIFPLPTGRQHFFIIPSVIQVTTCFIKTCSFRIPWAIICDRCNTPSGLVHFKISFSLNILSVNSHLLMTRWKALLASASSNSLLVRLLVHTLSHWGLLAPEVATCLMVSQVVALTLHSPPFSLG